MVKEEPLSYLTNVKLPPTADCYKNQKTTSLPSLITQIQLFMREGFPPTTVKIFRNFLINILPNFLNCFKTELDCHPNSLREFYGYISYTEKCKPVVFMTNHWISFPCIKDQNKLSEVLGALPILTKDAWK